LEVSIEMNIGVVGNREGWTYERVKEVLLEHNVFKSDVIITGGAEGVDAFAVQFAHEFGNEVHIFHPDPSVESPNRFYKRNLMIVLHSDIVIAFNRDGNVRTGTHNTITQANEHHRKVIEVTE
jgi:predicted Rossmann fold nucleotide-binding protein DprA/Smf involved in DNA uptake